MSDELQRALSAIDGVERAEVDIADDGPPSLRIRLARDADRRAVADAVQRLLESQGLRSRVAPDRRVPGPGTPPAPPSERYRPAGPPGPAPAPDRDSGPTSSRPEAGIEAVTVSESIDGLVVSVVAVGGRSAVRRARRTERGLHEAIVAAVDELFDPEAPPHALRGVEHSDSFPALTVYLESTGGTIRVGSAAVAAGSPFAFAQAVWAALRS